MKWSKYLIPNQELTKREIQILFLSTVAIAILCWALIPVPFMPSLLQVSHALHDLWFESNIGGELLKSFTLNIYAITIAGIISLLSGYLWTVAIFRSIVIFISQLRFLSLAGLGFAFTLMTSSGYQLKLLVLVFMVSVYMVGGVVDVIKAIPKEQFDLARTLRMGEWKTLWEVVVLGQVDQMFIVWRQNAAMGYMMIGTAEAMNMSGGGIGVLLVNSQKYLHLAEIMAIQLVVLFVGLVLQDQVIVWLRHTCCPYADLGKR